MKIHFGVAFATLALAASSFAHFQAPPKVQKEDQVKMLDHKVMSHPPIVVTVDGESIDFGKRQPIMLGGRVMVPMRGVFEKIGAVVDWTAADQTVIANGGGKSVSLQIGSHEAQLGDTHTTLDQPPVLVGGRTMVPLRFLSEAMGAHVEWDPVSGTVRIKTKQ